MTIVQDTRTFRFGFAALLCAAWFYGIAQWLQHTNGAWATLVGLLGFVLLGVAAWIAPIVHRGLRITVRIFGTIIGGLAMALFAGLIVLLRNGL